MYLPHIALAARFLPKNSGAVILDVASSPRTSFNLSYESRIAKLKILI